MDTRGMDTRGPFATAARSVGRAAALALALVLATPGPGRTQIVRDGTLGPAGPLTGPNYTIPHTDGTRAGPNLFHSFSRFNLGTNESATFTGPGEIANVISRVTGGERSTINGVLRSQVGRANVWFLNPAGVMFGPQARIDVPAAFHVSTADEVRFADGARFSASEPAASRLTVAPPEAFGFLRPNPAGIAVNGSQLETKPGQTLSLAGGALQVTGGKIASPGGRVNLTAMAGPGTVQAATGAPSRPARGAVRLANSARVDTSGDGGGRIALRGGQIEVTGSQVLANNTGTRDATGGITVDSDSLSLSRSEIGASAHASGKAGRVAVTARSRLAVRKGGVIYSDTSAQGAAGSVAIQADQLVVSGDGATAFTGIASNAETGSTGQAGTVTIHADRLLVSGDGSIASDAETGSTGQAGNVTVSGREIAVRKGGAITSTTASAQGQAGTVTIQADQLLISGDGARNANGTVDFTGIASNADPNSTGHAGHVSVTASGSLEVRNGGTIASATYAQGNAGTVTIHADRLLVSGDEATPFTGIASSAEKGSTGNAGIVTVTGRDITVRDSGRIISSTSAQGAGGHVSVTAHGTLELRNGGAITSATYAQGNAGTVTIHADRLLVSGDGATAFTGITSSAEKGSTGNAGGVTVSGREIEVRNGGQILNSTFAQGQAGTVTIHADQLLVSGDGARNADGTVAFTGISSDAESGSTGQAGGVTVTAARSLEVRKGGAITSETRAQGNAGTVTVHADRVLISGDGARNADGTVAAFIIGISSQAYSGSTGQAGNITVTGRDIEVRNGGQISSATSPGSAGAGGTVDVHGGDIRLADSGTITTQSGSSRHGGAITLTADGSLSLTGGARITSLATQADAGRITIDAKDSVTMTGSSITTEATQGEGGQINLRVGRLIGLFSGSGVTTSATGGGSTGNAGNIMIDPQILVVDRDSRIKANAREGNGGRIDLIADNILVWPPLEERITARSERGISGQVNIYAPDQDVGRMLTPLPSGFLDASALLPTACATRVGAPTSRFKPNLVASLPSDPNGPLVGSYLSYLGHRPPDRGGPSGTATATAAPLAQGAAPAVGRPRLSFACGI